MTRPTIDDLEMLNPTELGKLLHAEILIYNRSPDIQYIQDLLDVGCPIDCRDIEGLTIFHFSVLMEHFEVVEFLISRGIDIDQRTDVGRGALHYAASSGNLKAVEFLLSHGADINARDIHGQTALHQASRYGGCPGISKALISWGAQVDIRDNDGRTAWDHAYSRTRESIPELEPR